jgi:hypothetical protein
MSSIRPQDRRGLGEIVALASIVFAISIVISVELNTGHDVPKELFAMLFAACSILLARGTQGAGERSASSELRNYEAEQLRAAQAEQRVVIGELRQFQGELVRQLLAQSLEGRLPPLPAPPAPAPVEEKKS